MRTIAFFILLIFPGLMLAQEAEYVKKYYPNGNVRYEGFFADGKPVGLLKRYHENGKLWVEQTFDDLGNSEVKVYNGEGVFSASGSYTGRNRSGKWLYYNSNGRIIMEENYVDGMLDGECKSYDFEGNLLEYSFYRLGDRDSVRIQYYPNGNVMAKFSYDKGILNGDFRSYYYDGYPEYSGTYKNGKRDGWWYYTDDMYKTDSLFFVDGKSEQLDKLIISESLRSDSIISEYFVDPEQFMDDPMQIISF